MKQPIGRAYERYEGWALPVVQEVRSVDVGSVRVGVSYRVITEAEVMASGITLPQRLASMNCRGASIQISDAATGTEYLRFDCFDEDPHYHYMVATEKCMYNVGFDTVACGPMVAWVPDAIAQRLGDMLELVGAGHLAAGTDAAEVARVVAELVADAETAGRALAGGKNA